MSEAIACIFYLALCVVIWPLPFRRFLAGLALVWFFSASLIAVRLP